MKSKLELEDEQELEILKTVAQAWLGHSGSSRTANEFDAHRQNFKSKPTRFKLEAMNKLLGNDNVGAMNWDFGQSLWDSFEIVTMSKRLEAGLVLDNPFSGADGQSRVGSIRVVKRPRESKNSLRKLFYRTSSSSSRFNEADIPSV